MTTETKRPGPQVDEQTKASFVGKTGTVELEGLMVNVSITDVRRRYGHLDFAVTPLNGERTIWKQSDRIAIRD